MKRPLHPPPCACLAYPFPHRCGRGACSRRQPLVIGIGTPPGPLACFGDVHRKDCRPGRPLCRARRAMAKHGVCRCDAYHHPHRHGPAGRCAGGFADPTKMYAHIEQTVRRRTCAQLTTNITPMEHT